MVKTRLRCTYKVDPQTGALLDNKGHRVRWVACGYSQLFGKDYFQTYTATTKSAGIRVYCSMVAALDLDTEHIDLCKFFPSHALQEEVYCEQMPGFVSEGLRADGKSKLVCRLKMALEGLKQSGNTACDGYRLFALALASRGSVLRVSLGCIVHLTSVAHLS